MKIEWNKVTPLSKSIALALFIALPFIGFTYGVRYGAALRAISGTGAREIAVPAAMPGSAYYNEPAFWQTDSNNPGFSIAYPIDFDAADNYRPAAGPAWRAGASTGETGATYFTLTIPRALEPQTNFAGAKLAVSVGANAAALANCLDPGAGLAGGPPGTGTSTAMIAGTPFVVFHATDAGAGNLYDITSYSAIRAGKCWNIEYSIHSAQIGNFPGSYGLHPFSEPYVSGILERVLGTFEFIK